MEKKPTYTETFGELTPPENTQKAGILDRLFLNASGVSWLARHDNPQEAPLFEMVARLCPKMGIQNPPKLIIYQSPYPNAASALGGAVLISSNLLKIMTPQQVESVMGHELSHHRHKLRDMGIMFGGIIATDFAYHKTLRPKIYKMIDGIKNSYARIAARIAAPIAEFLTTIGMINLYQQKIEYQADRESGEATGHPETMAGALQALEGRVKTIQKAEQQKSRGGMSDTRKVIADMIDRLEPKWVRRIRNNPFEVLGSHPPIPLRVEALKAQEAQLHSKPPVSPHIG